MQLLDPFLHLDLPLSALELLHFFLWTGRSSVIFSSEMRNNLSLHQPLQLLACYVSTHQYVLLSVRHFLLFLLGPFTQLRLWITLQNQCNKKQLTQLKAS